jgi:hypothetical protein
VYGAGPARAQTDRYAERGSRFWIAVDGDGDGVRAFLPDSPAIDVRPGPPAELRVTVPSIARPGEEIRVVIAVLDAALDTGVSFAGDAVFVDPPAGSSCHARCTSTAARAGVAPCARSRARRAPIASRSPREICARSATRCSSPRRVRACSVGDLHGHSALSDGTGTARGLLRLRARRLRARRGRAHRPRPLGILPLAEHPELWREIRARRAASTRQAASSTLLGFEWTSWIHGHRHVLYFADDGPVIDSLAEATDSPAELWSALGERRDHDPTPSRRRSDRDRLGPAPDPRFEPDVEIVSIHGSSEAPTRRRIHEPVAGHFARDALARGYRLGFVGSGDRHDGHPGAFATDPAEGGLAAILSEERTREACCARCASGACTRPTARGSCCASRSAARRWAACCRSRPAHGRARRCS